MQFCKVRDVHRKDRSWEWVMLRLTYVPVTGWGILYTWLTQLHGASEMLLECYDARITDEETEAQGNELIFWKSYSSSMRQPEFPPKLWHHNTQLAHRCTYIRGELGRPENNVTEVSSKNNYLVRISGVRDSSLQGALVSCLHSPAFNF